MNCPVCNNDHVTRPIQCLQAATLDHVGQCGIGTEHLRDCLLKSFMTYVDAKPEWRRGARPTRNT